MFSDILCSQAELSCNDMDKVINKKLLKYYHVMHPDFIHSDSFNKLVTETAAQIQSNQKFVYLKLSHVLQEMNLRRKADKTLMTNKSVSNSTSDTGRDSKIHRLNRVLLVLKKEIVEFENSEVDLADESNSLYLQTGMYKKRACEIYKKICELTGKSKSWHKRVQKPISFNGTKYPQFNVAIQSFVNETSSFPDIFDVLRILQHCNKQDDLKMGKAEIKAICESIS